MDSSRVVPYNIIHDALPRKELMNAPIESYRIQHLPLELSFEGVMGDEIRDRLAITIDLVHIIRSADARLDGYKRVRVCVLTNTCLRCYGSEDKDRYARLLEDPDGYRYGSRTRFPRGRKTFGDLISAFETSNIPNFLFTPTKGQGPALGLAHGKIKGSAKKFLKGPSMHEDESNHVCRIATTADMENALALFEDF
ncbi:unnamed protein product [Clonostachys solani]|uniref:Uncharacterized protein n=1 Tax=Clonostachys solani TaxID=160281 RepID=A0A9N9W6D7_9HYPO|nr:unnamed protein product [Clonostachys solani]